VRNIRMARPGSDELARARMLVTMATAGAVVWRGLPTDAGGPEVTT
jgi:hypothetical protein